MATRRETIQKILPKMAKFQANLERAISGHETGRHQISVIISNGEIKKVQVFTEDTVDIVSDGKCSQPE